MGRHGTTHGDQNEASWNIALRLWWAVGPAIPPSPMGPMSTAREPSLEFCSEPELMEQSNEILMEASGREIVGVRWGCPRKGNLQIHKLTSMFQLELQFLGCTHISGQFHLGHLLFLGSTAKLRPNFYDHLRLKAVEHLEQNTVSRCL